MKHNEKAILKKLGIKLYEEFNILELPYTRFRIIDGLKVQEFIEKIDYWSGTDVTIRDFLFKRLQIVKIPKETELDRIIIAYAKALGIKYIAKDLCGNTWGYTEKPFKKGFEWFVDKGKAYYLYLSPSFVSWDDPEALYIGEARGE